MKNILLIFAVLLTASQLPAQILTPVKWSTSIEQVSEAEFDLIFTADIDEGWVVYSQFIEEGGPIGFQRVVSVGAEIDHVHPVAFHHHAGVSRTDPAGGGYARCEMQPDAPRRRRAEVGARGPGCWFGIGSPSSTQPIEPLQDVT